MRQLTHEEVLKIPDLAASGMTITQMATFLESTPKTISNYIKRLRESGKEVKTKRGRPPIKV